MKVNFRQGVVSYQSGGFLQVVGDDVSLLATNRSVTITIAHKDTDYTHSEDNSVNSAWPGPFTETQYWLYWDFNPLTFARTFGTTTLEPIAQSTEPVKVEGQHWYDTSIDVHYVLNGGVWQSVLRVFAAQLLNGNTFISVSQSGDFSGTQIANNTAVFSGRVLFDESSDPITKKTGTFFTTEDQFFTNQSRVDALRLESNVIRAQGIGTLSAFSVVAWTNDGHVVAAQYDNVGSTIVGLLTENLTNLEVGAIIVQGGVTNPTWNWTTGAGAVPVGSTLWVKNGLLVTTDPNLDDPLTYPIARVPVARVLDKDTIIFEQGLGGIGVQGPQGVPGPLEAANTTDLGSVTLLTPSSDSSRAFVISDTDQRLSNARTPLAHTHQAADVTFQPSGGVISTEVQAAIIELDNDKFNLSGGTLTGFLTLNADPTAIGHAASKRYVDDLTASKLDISGGTMTGSLTLSGDPIAVDHATTKQYVDDLILQSGHIDIPAHAAIDAHIADTTIHFSLLSSLSNVEWVGSPPAPVDGQQLQYNTTSEKWENKTGPSAEEITTLGEDVASSSIINTITSRRVLLSDWSLQPALVSTKYEHMMWASSVSLFIALELTTGASTTAIHTSPDGLTWTKRTHPSSQSLRKILWSPLLNQIIVMGQAGMLVSSDGINWTLTATGVNGGWGLASSSSLIIAVEFSTNHDVYISADGTNFTQYDTIFQNSSAYDITWSEELGQFFMLYDKGIVARSADGITWFNGSQMHLTSAWRRIHWITELGLLIAIQTNPNGQAIATSPDGITWTARTTDSTIYWQNLTWVAELDMVVAVGSDIGGAATAPCIMTSTDGITWTTITVPHATDVWTKAIAWSPTLGIFVAVSSGSSDTDILISTL